MNITNSGIKHIRKNIVRKAVNGIKKINTDIISEGFKCDKDIVICSLKL